MTHSQTPQSSDQFRIALAGVGGQGYLNARAGARCASIAAVFDPDLVALNRSKKTFSNAKHFESFQDLWRNEHLFDGLIISSPDHTHFPYIMKCLNFGKHCFCEKPIVQNLGELKKLQGDLSANKAPITTHVGIQSLTSTHFWDLVHFLKSIDQPLKRLVVWTDRPTSFFDAPDHRLRVSAQSAQQLNVEEWCANRGSHHFKQKLHPVSWRRSPHFGTGPIGDMGSHLMTLPYFTFGLQTILDTKVHPLRQSAQGSKIDIKFTSKIGRNVDLEWFEGAKPTISTEGLRLAENGLYVEFEETSIYCSDWNFSNVFLKDKHTWQNVAFMGGIPVIHHKFLEQSKSPIQYWVENAFEKKESVASIERMIEFFELLLLIRQTQIRSG